VLNEILYLAFLSLVVCYADYRMTANNMGAIWNGIGAIPSVLRGEAQLPMQHRLLIPLICKWFCGMQKSPQGYYNVYVRLRFVSIVGAIYTSYWWFSTVMTAPLLGVSALCFWFVLAALYDYADTYVEVLFFALALSVMPFECGIAIICMLMIPAVMNKETALFIPLLAIAHGEYWMGFGAMAVGVAYFIMIKTHYNEAERYCEFFMFKRNIRTIKKTLVNFVLLNEYMFFFSLMLFSIVIYVVGIQTLLPIDMVMAGFVLLMLIPSMWREIRVFSPFMLTFIPLVERVL